jgi:hypothetical protein
MASLESVRIFLSAAWIPIEFVLSILLEAEKLVSEATVVAVDAALYPSSFRV